MKIKENLNKTFFCLLLLIFSFDIIGQSINSLYNSSKKEWSDGNFKEAEEYLYEMLLLEDSLTDRHKVAIYNRFGLINHDIGNYKKALAYYKKAERLCIENIGEDYSLLSLVYNNMARIYKINGDLDKAVEYYNIALNSINGSDLTYNKKVNESSKIHQNLGTVYKNLKLYSKAIEHFSKSEKLKNTFSLEGLEYVYANLARTYEELNDYNKSEKFYLKSIREWEKKIRDENKYKSANVYNDYSSFLLKIGKKKDALEYFNVAHQIYLDNYGLRHPFTANSFRTIGDFYFQTDQIEKALKNYQKSIISNTKQFNDSNIFSLPLLEDVIADIQLLTSLSKKSEALYKYSEKITNKQEQLKILNACINTVDLSLKHLSNIRRGYMLQSSKLNITQDEKKSYFQAIEASLKLFEITKEEKYKKLAYIYSQKSKASLLRVEILQNKAFAAILPDSIRQKKLDVETNIYSYKKLIFDENQEKNPDKEKIDKWSHTLFKLNNEYEDLITKIKENYADYEKLTSKTEIISLENLQKRLNKDETIVEYSLAPLSEDGHRKLFIFVVTKDQLNYFKNDLDSSFTTDINHVREQMNKHEAYASSLQEYNRLNEQLYHLYSDLIQPVEKYFKGTNIFVIPDEEIAYLSFDALQKQFTKYESINYAAIPYLIYDYCFSYAYASSLLFQDVPEKYKKEFVYAFAPNYSGTSISSSRLQFGKLENTEKEIKSVLTWFDGKALVGREANEEFFKTISNQCGIFHFAMHASAEKDNPDFSFLAITQEDENEEDGMFYNYEIAMMNMKASMVVLSGCNTGDGVISSGEGVMSLTRNFILAGVPSIVHSLWEVQDETSVVIMDKFYEYLSKGLPKNEALRQAKLDYIQNVSPAMVNPYFWSGYIHSGNPKPVVNRSYLIYGVLFFSVGILFLALFLWKRRKTTRKI
jgi:CHAT domain-containing protein